MTGRSRRAAVDDSPTDGGLGGRPVGRSQARSLSRPRVQGFADESDARRYLAVRRLPTLRTVHLYHRASYDDFAQVLYAYLCLGYDLSPTTEPGVTVLMR